jgi:hypothetical protein
VVWKTPGERNWLLGSIPHFAPVKLPPKLPPEPSRYDTPIYPTQFSKPLLIHRLQSTGTPRVWLLISLAESSWTDEIFLKHGFNALAGLTGLTATEKKKR